MLKGAPELRRRLTAIRQVFKPAEREWPDATIIEAKRRIPVVTGQTRASIRRGVAAQGRVTVVGRYPVNFIDAGVKAHDIRPRKMKVLRFEAGGRTIFARKVHKRAQAAKPFKKEAAQAGLRKVDIIGDLVELWNRAA